MTSWRSIVVSIFVLALALAAWSVGTKAALSLQGADKSIFVTVLDQSGAPVNDLTLADFGVAEDNTIREVAVVKRDELLFASVLVDTTSAVQPRWCARHCMYRVATVTRREPASARRNPSRPRTLEPMPYPMSVKATSSPPPG